MSSPSPITRSGGLNTIGLHLRRANQGAILSSIPPKRRPLKTGYSVHLLTVEFPGAESLTTSLNSMLKKTRLQQHSEALDSAGEDHIRRDSQMTREL